MNKHKRPNESTDTRDVRLMISMGDPAGVGPEIILKAFSTRREWLKGHFPVVCGTTDVLESYGDALKLDIAIHAVKEDELETFTPSDDAIFVLEPEGISLPPFVKLAGNQSRETGLASFKYVAESVRNALRGTVDGIVTAPISKFAWNTADINFPGHTEMLAHYAGVDDFAMVLAAEKIRVVLATIHIPLNQVSNSITRGGLIRLFKLVDTYMPLFDVSIERARIGVCGLNPHAGEEGILGNEEERIIHPAMEQARNEGIDVQGPFPADTIFHRMREGDFDVIVAMYHDQGIIPVKTLDFFGGVNITLGLPFIRTSVDHGTAFPIAGKGIARPDSLIQATNLATTLAANKRTLQAKKDTHD